MGEVKIAKPCEGQHQGQAHRMAHEIVQPAAVKRRVMGAFMAEREKEHGQNAKRQRRQPPAGPAHDDWQRKGPQARHMPGKMQQAPQVGSFLQGFFAGGGQGGEGGFVVHLSPLGCRTRERQVRTRRSGSPG